MEVLSEHLCQGWLEGYLLTGRHGIFPCYEAFALIVDSMLNQHGKCSRLAKNSLGENPLVPLTTYSPRMLGDKTITDTVTKAPGFIESVMQKKASVARIYLPPDANCLLAVGDHCLRSKNYINLIVSGKQPMPQWLTMEQAKKHCEKGASIWDWASNDDGNPDIIMAAAGDTPTEEILAAISLTPKTIPRFKDPDGECSRSVYPASPLSSSSWF